MRLPAPPELASDDDDGDGAVTRIADAGQGKSGGKRLARPILSTSRPPPARLLSSVAVRCFAAMRGGVNHLLLTADMRI